MKKYVWLQKIEIFCTEKPITAHHLSTSEAYNARQQEAIPEGDDKRTG